MVTHLRFVGCNAIGVRQAVTGRFCQAAAYLFSIAERSLVKLVHFFVEGWGFTLW